MRFAVETWDPEYGVGADQAELEPTAGDVDAEVERTLGAWAPVRPDPTTPVPASVAFVDGVQRIDARVWITASDGVDGGDGGRVHPGVCATVAAGLVRASGGVATIVASRVVRGLFAAAAGAESIHTRHGDYQLFVTADGSPEGLYRGLQERMTVVEAAISAEVEPIEGNGDKPGSGETLVVFDGPLRRRNRSDAVGLVKTQHVQYLPDRAQRVLTLLEPGERSPLFVIGGGGFTRWSWYLRLPGPKPQPLAGIVRCELASAAAASVADAAARAEQVSLTLPRFASEPHKDSRAPQNLYPIAGLERDLRRRLGDPALMERALRLAAALP